MQNIEIPTKNKGYIGLVASMALKARQNAEAFNSIIAKGYVYPLQNLCASKSAAHGFASKSDTHHKTKRTASAVLFVLAHKWRTRKAGPEKALNRLFPAVAFSQKSESNGWQDQNIFFQQNLNCGQIRTATPVGATIGRPRTCNARPYQPNYLQSHRLGGILDRCEPAKRLKCLQNCGIMKIQNGGIAYG